MKSRIFISSVQREFAKERKALASCTRHQQEGHDRGGHQESVCHACAQPGWMEKLLLKGSNA